MADLRNGREIRKRRLKENMIDRNAKVEIVAGRQFPVLPVLLLAAAALIAVFFYYRQVSYTAETSEVVWEKELTGEEATVAFRGYCSFADGIVMYTKDGAEYTDSDGNSVWQKSYQMNSPVISTQGSYCVIADQGGTTACIFSETENTGTIATVMPISKAAVSGNGVTYLVENDTGADFLMAYRKDGSEIDLSVKSVVDGDGYPFDIGVSPDGSQLLCSYAAITEGAVQSSVVFRNFGEVGQNADARRVVGGFIDEFKDHIVTKVGFSDETYSHAFYDGGVVFFSTKVLNSPEILSKAEFEETMLAVADGTEYCAVVTESPEEDGKKRLLIYDKSGNQTGSADFDLSISGLEANEKNIIVYSTDRILAYSVKGKLLADLSRDGEISAVCGTDNSRAFLVAENNRLLYVKGR